MIQVKKIADSIANGLPRLTTLELTYPRFIHSELMTHRQLNRCASSSRAIPVATMMRIIRDNPACPVYWGANQKGMQAAVELEGWRYKAAKFVFLQARWAALLFAWILVKLNLHKQIANRILEPWAHMTTVVTATEWDNFFALRTDINAQPEFRSLATEMLSVMNNSVPQLLRPGQWHLPYVEGGCSAEDDPSSQTVEGFFASPVLKQSVAGCARTSYRVPTSSPTGKKASMEEEAVLYERLLSKSPIHASPAEHQAQVPRAQVRSKGLGGNLRGGWIQLRKLLAGENITEFKRLRHWHAFRNKLSYVEHLDGVSTLTPYLRNSLGVRIGVRIGGQP